MAADEVGERGTEVEAHEGIPGAAQHQDERHQGALGTPDGELSEVRPVDLSLLARQGAKAQIRFLCMSGAARRGRRDSQVSRGAGVPVKAAARPAAAGCRFTLGQSAAIHQANDVLQRVGHCLSVDLPVELLHRFVHLKTLTRITLPRAEHAIPWKLAPSMFSWQPYLDQCPKGRTAFASRRYTKANGG